MLRSEVRNVTPNSHLYYILGGKRKGSSAVAKPNPDVPLYLFCVLSEQRSVLCCSVLAAGLSLISPCLCKGTMRYVHVSCLEQWRSTSTNPTAAYECDSCKFRYSFERSLTARHPLSPPLRRRQTPPRCRAPGAPLLNWCIAGIVHYRCGESLF